MENYRLEKRTSPKSLYGVVTMVFGAGLSLLLASVLLTYSTGAAWLQGLLGNSPIIAIVLFVLGLVGFIGVSFFGRRMKLWLLLTMFAISLPYFAIVTNIMLLTYLPNQNLLPVLGIMLVPGGIMLIMGIIGYYELINIRKVQIAASFVFIAFIVALIISLFWRSESFSWWLSPLIVLMISLFTIGDFFMMRQELENAQYGDSREMIKIAAWYGVRLFFNYVILLWHIIRIFGRR